MILSKQDFENATAFELYILERICQPRTVGGGSELDLRSQPSQANIHTVMEEGASGKGVSKLKSELTPLIFGAAWKAIDLLLEFALNKANLSSGKEWRINEKEKHAQAANGDMTVLGCTQPVWKALMSLYASTVEHRHCLVHRTANVDYKLGTLSGMSKKNQPLLPLTFEQMEAFAKIGVIVIRATTQGHIESRSEDQLKYFLDRLTAHTKKPSFGVVGSNVPVTIRLDLQENGDHFLLDMTKVIQQARQIYSDTRYFDLKIGIPDGSGRLLFARAEDCPTAVQAIYLNAIPSWLQFR